jgi:hypothetical protein
VAGLPSERCAPNRDPLPFASPSRPRRRVALSQCSHALGLVLSRSRGCLRGPSSSPAVQLAARTGTVSARACKQRRAPRVQPSLDWERKLATWRMRQKRHWTHCMSYWLLDAPYVLLAFLVDRWRSAQACSTRGLTSFAIHSFSLRRQTPRSVDAPISSQCATSFRLCYVLLAVSVCSPTDPTRLVRNGPQPNKLCGFHVSFSVVP